MDKDKIFLLTRPDHEYRVSYLYAWSEGILEFAKNNNILFTDFKRVNASKDKVENCLKGKNPSMVIFNGHGNADAILGHKDEPLIRINDNEELLKDKIVYARACWAADSLGKSIISKGGKCFIGYSQPFAWDETSKEIRFWLFWDIQHQKLLGNGDAKFS